MRITMIMFIALVFSSSCKTEGDKNTVQEKVPTENANELIQEGEVISDTLSVVVQSNETTDIVNTQTKSVPKTETKPQTEKLESVSTDKSGNTSTTPPRPEPEMQTSKLENVKVDNDNSQEIIKEKFQNQVSHAEFDELLRNHVSTDGKVNYKAIKANIGTLDSYLRKLEKTNIDALSRNGQLAFWINAYNAYTIKLILKHYPLESITQINNGKPWDLKWINLNGQTLSLDYIENNIIRPEFKDSRIHFALNCAAKSCPPLFNKAYNANNVESFLDKQTKKFILNTEFNQLEGSPIKISKIFQWYKDDFGNVIDYINYYGNQAIDNTENIFFNGYDWRLNE